MQHFGEQSDALELALSNEQLSLLLVDAFFHFFRLELPFSLQMFQPTSLLALTQPAELVLGLLVKGLLFRLSGANYGIKLIKLLH